MRAGRLIESVPSTAHLREHGAGERAAISLAVEHPGWALFIDDRRPFLTARRMGLTVVCTPLLVVRLADEQVFSTEEADVLLRHLLAFNTVSPSLIEQAALLLRRLSEAADTETDR